MRTVTVAVSVTSSYTPPTLAQIGVLSAPYKRGSMISSAESLEGPFKQVIACSLLLPATRRRPRPRSAAIDLRSA